MFIIYKQTYLLCVNTIFIPNFDSNFIQSQMVDLKLMADLATTRHIARDKGLPMKIKDKESIIVYMGNNAHSDVLGE